MLTKKFYLQHTIDVYVSELSDDNVRITFHRMTTREKIEINTNKSFAQFLAFLNGERTILEILNLFNSFDITKAQEAIKFLQANHLITEKSSKDNENSRYARQIAYFDDMVFTRTGVASQNLLALKKIVIFGVGAVTSIIVEALVRAGIENVVLIDYKKITKSNLSRHLYGRSNDIGKFKVEVLKNYLKKINNNLNITTISNKLLPHTDLSDYIPSDTNIVINGCDEPYIGHTSMKLGLYLQTKNIPLYVIGGFDAHLMSSGELVYPPKTPCISCIQKTFSNALHDWKPIYTKTDSIQQIKIDCKENIEFTHNIGGSGGIVMMNSFSGYIGALKVIHFLVDDPYFEYQSMRYEYLPNKGTMTGFGLLKQEGCHVCNKK